MSAPTVPMTTDGQLARLEFGRFDLDAYQLFLRVKTMPEHQVAYEWESDRYLVTMPARFAARLAGEVERPETRYQLASHLMDYQAYTVGHALDARRFAIWLDTGLGKTCCFLEWANHVRDMTNGRVLILPPLQVIPQTVNESLRFYDPTRAPSVIRSREELADWCRQPGPAIGITNYEKLIPGQLPELRYLAGIALDESSILKAGGGVIKWNLIHSARGIEYKLSCTATPAPNDRMEYASQASFLEKMRDGNEVIWTFFNKRKDGTWEVKPHARKAFYRFMAGWSIYMRDPARFGFADILADLPDPVIHEYTLPLGEEQRRLMYELTETKGGLFSDDRLGVRERIKLSQLAKGFLYEPGSSSKRWATVPSAKPAFVADLVRQEVAAGRQCIVWTAFDEEARMISRLLGSDVPHLTLDGSQDATERTDLIEAEFRAGNVAAVISKPQLLGYGLNLQFCKAMVFSGFDDSFERAYQAIRRCYRFGQTEPVHVHWPFIPELEGMVYGNVKRKEQQFLADVAQCEDAYREAMAEVYGREVAA